VKKLLQIIGLGLVIQGIDASALNGPPLGAGSRLGRMSPLSD